MGLYLDCSWTSYSMRVLVYGGRDFNKRAMLFAALDYLDKEFKFTTVIDGMARGADDLAFQWAIARGVPTERFPAQWDLYGKSAGFIRNKQMRDEGKPDLGVAFPGGAGTSMMTRLLLEAGITVKHVTPK